VASVGSTASKLFIVALDDEARLPFHQCAGAILYAFSPKGDTRSSRGVSARGKASNGRRGTCCNSHCGTARAHSPCLLTCCQCKGAQRAADPASRGVRSTQGGLWLRLWLVLGLVVRIRKASWARARAGQGQPTQDGDWYLLVPTSCMLQVKSFLRCFDITNASSSSSTFYVQPARRRGVVLS
jgi:hypothetical protein